MSLPLTLKARIAKSGTSAIDPTKPATSEIILQILGSANPTALNNAGINVGLPLSGLTDSTLAGLLPVGTTGTLTFTPDPAPAAAATPAASTSTAAPAAPAAS